MNKEEITKLLSGKNEVIEAHSNIVSMQKDKSSLIRTGQDWLDDNLVGGLNNKMVFLGSRPSNGKTYHCSQTINSLLDRELNPQPIKILRLNLEMPTEALYLRELSKKLHRKPSDIISRPFTEKEQIIVKEIITAFTDKRIKNVSTTLKGDNFKFLIQEFVREIDEADELVNKEPRELFEKNKKPDSKEVFIPKKTKKVVLVDHLHVYLTKEVIDTILSICNDLKMADSNLSFIYYFQLNRETENMWRESKDKKVNPRNMLPNATSIYLTDLLQQFADIVVAMVIPQVYDMEEYVAINKERNMHLKQHFGQDNGDNAFVRVKGRNRIYYNFIKIRMVDDFDDSRLYCEILNPEFEKTAEKLYKESKEVFGIATPTFEKPVIEKLPTVTPNFDLANAFSAPDNQEKDDSPF